MLPRWLLSSLFLPAPDCGSWPACKPSRFSQLDALRGVAALVVVAHHFFLALPNGDPTAFWIEKILPLRIIVLGRPAVILFFVLSGFVLTLSLRAAPCSSWKLYATRRICRLFPPFFVVILGSYVLYLTVPVYTIPTLSEWYNSQWKNFITPLDVFLHLTMSAGAHQYPLDHVAWSLVHEFRLSLILPIIIFMINRVGIFGSLCLCAALSYDADVFVALHSANIPHGYNGFLFDTPNLLVSLILTARFLCAFAIGAALALRLDTLSQLARRKRWVIPLVALIASITLSCASEWLMTLGAACLIFVAANSRRFAWMLQISPLIWLGRVSYSLYLIHLPVMMVTGLWLAPHIGAYRSLLLSILASLLLAELMHRLIERPAIEWGRKLSTSKRLTAPSPALSDFGWYRICQERIQNVRSLSISALQPPDSAGRLEDGGMTGKEFRLPCSAERRPG